MPILTLVNTRYKKTTNKFIVAIPGTVYYIKILRHYMHFLSEIATLFLLLHELILV